ncbi:LysR family transcriptional regulator [Salinivibrio sp. ES.052]|uniref:LysR family transcriptional regulator n=1 Tax=Salinivibrio sp. ES.052 TaxID=1882823 RepID=UPI000926EDA3|nr:LysR family transcriptional regulator [Salinivibrio sp. ES.052]SIO38322.1 DNA-binding transcriptional regulator, LysR family [Salinivibrio sp. ES.052]
MDVEKAASYFLAVADSGSIKAAALQLGISQPSLTAQIQKLERRLSSQLLARHPRGVSMTPAGKLYYQHATAQHASRQRLQAQLHALQAREAGQVKLGTGEAWWPLFVESAVVAYQAEHQCSVHIEFGNRLALMSSLLNGDIDVFIGHEISELIATSQVRFIPLFQDTEAWFAYHAHPLFKPHKGDVTIDECLSDWPLLRVTPDHPRHAHLLSRPLPPLLNLHPHAFDLDSLSASVSLLQSTQTVMPYTDKAASFLSEKGINVLWVNQAKRGNVGIYTASEATSEKVSRFVACLLTSGSDWMEPNAG